MTERLDAVVIGAGVVGLAVARKLALAGHEVVVLEKAEAIGTGISSRNSEVIHAGLYYPPGSLKARLCVAGKRALYDYLQDHALPHRRVGKVLVACSDSQLAKLDDIAATAAANGVDDLVRLDRAGVKEREPALDAVAGLWSPSTGILDVHAFMLALQGDIEAAGGAIALGSPVEGATVTDDGIALAVGGAEPMGVIARTLVNAAGLDAPGVAGTVQGLVPDLVPTAYYAKGCYFTLTGRNPFRHLVYPLPEPGGLGVHVTLDLGGQARFGPDVEWVEAGADYQVDPARAAGFEAAIRRYWPDLPDGALSPGYAGIRPKISGPRDEPADFVIQGPEHHAIPGLVNLFGIESPGLTSSLAIADEVLRRLGR